MESINEFASEVIAETIGTSRRKWALIVFALVVGASLAMWLVGRGHSDEPAGAADSGPRQ